MNVRVDTIVIPNGGYRTIVADPPWKYGKWGKASKPRCAGHIPKESEMPYEQMTVDKIKALSVADIAAEDCDLYLWTTQKYLPHAFDVLKAWGFKYCQTLTWCKAPMGTGQGGLYCPTSEFLLLGRKGKKTHRSDQYRNQKNNQGSFFHDLSFFADLCNILRIRPKIV